EEEEANVNLNYDSENETYQNNWNNEISESLSQIVSIDKDLLNYTIGNAGEGSSCNVCDVVGNASGNSYQSFSNEKEIEY
ncbi:1490_t:CDS:1, partial [Ambispora leptoticha]